MRLRVSLQYHTSRRNRIQDMITNRKHGILVTSCSVFFGVGVLAATLGPALPELAKGTGSSLAEVGAVFSALFLGGLISQVVSGLLIERLGFRPLLLVGLMLAALGTL